MGLVKCTTALSQGAHRAEVGDIIDTSNVMYVLWPTYFSAQDVELDTLVAGAPTSAYTQTYSTPNKTVAAPTAGALTDNSTGAASTTFAAGIGVYLLQFPVVLANLANGEVITDMVIPHKFKVLSISFNNTIAATTADKAASINVDIGATPTTGGVLALTSANCTPKGAVVAGSAITAANTGAAAGIISLIASAVTPFVEGEGIVRVAIQNMDTADAVASLVAEHAKLVADDLDNRQSISALIDDLQSLGMVG